jgi:hypothetical protein
MVWCGVCINMLKERQDQAIRHHTCAQGPCTGHDLPLLPSVPCLTGHPPCIARCMCRQGIIPLGPRHVVLLAAPLPRRERVAKKQ